MHKLARTRLNLVQQAHVLKRDHGLIGEISDQLDLLFTECPNLLSVDGDRADELMLVEHRDNDERSGTTKFGGSDEIRIALDPDLLPWHRGCEPPVSSARHGQDRFPDPG